MTKEAVQMNKTTVIKYLEYSREIDDEVKIKPLPASIGLNFR